MFWEKESLVWVLLYLLIFQSMNSFYGVEKNSFPYLLWGIFLYRVLITADYHRFQCGENCGFLRLNLGWIRLLLLSIFLLAFERLFLVTMRFSSMREVGDICKCNHALRCRKIKFYRTKKMWLAGYTTSSFDSTHLDHEASYLLEIN